MKRTGFASRTPRREATQTDYMPRPRAPAVAQCAPTMAEPQPKANPVRSEEYRRLVAAMPCAVCNIEGVSQCAHADEGKGLGIKSDDRLCFPLCADQPGKMGCHALVGSSGKLPKEARREFEQRVGEETARAIYASGKWPKGVAVPWFIAMDEE